MKSDKPLPDVVTSVGNANRGMMHQQPETGHREDHTPPNHHSV